MGESYGKTILKVKFKRREYQGNIVFDFESFHRFYVISVDGTLGMGTG